MLGDTPQTLVLAAEAEKLAGKEDAAGAIFNKLADDPSARFLGLRGLLRQAMQREDWPEAQRLAREAEAAQPGAAWLREERRLLAERTRDWREALALSAHDGPRAAFALAAAAAEPDAAKAAELEKQAVAADAKFAPAALAQASRLMAAGSQRRARGVLEAAWNAAPHPDLGAAWIEALPAPLARVKAVEDLTHRDPSHPEARLLMARVALAAGLTGRARSELMACSAAGRRIGAPICCWQNWNVPSMAIAPKAALPRPPGCAKPPMPPARRAGVAMAAVRNTAPGSPIARPAVRLGASAGRGAENPAPCPMARALY